MTTLALICGWATGAVLGGMALLFWIDPALGMRQTTHVADQLPRVMAGRYTALAVLAVGLTLYGDLTALAILFAVCAGLGLVDAILYARAGHPWGKHLGAGLAALVALAIALMAR